MKTEWTIHPFIWQLKPGAKAIKFDWEHTEYQFVKPEDLDKFDHVPQLEVGLNRALVSEETERGLIALKEDHESGAQALAVKALKILLGLLRGDELTKFGTTEEFWRALRWRAWHLVKNGRPSMGAAIEAEVLKALDTARNHLLPTEYDSFGSIPLETVKSNVESAIEGRISARQHSLQTLAGFFVKFVESNWPVDEQGQLPPPIKMISIVTLSSSGTIIHCLQSLIEHAAKKEIYVKLTVLESRPKFEGISLVNKLLKSYKTDPNILPRLKVEIVSDASIATVVKDADYLVFGGDKVLPNGDVSNKIGSFPAALMAKTLGIKVVAVFETGKITSAGFDSGHLEIEYNDAAEMTSAWPPSLVDDLKLNQGQGIPVEVKNRYFEWVPAEYIDQYISEEGPLNKEDIARLSGESEELEKRLFGTL